jgi:hypothetical protein
MRWARIQIPQERTNVQNGTPVKENASAMRSSQNPAGAFAGA